MSLNAKPKATVKRDKVTMAVNRLAGAGEVKRVEMSLERRQREPLKKVALLISTWIIGRRR